MKLRKPAAAEIVQCLDRVLAANDQEHGPEDASLQSLCAPLKERNFNNYSLDEPNERWTRAASLGASGTVLSRAMRVC